jgi:hypothetical protein
MRPVLLAFLFAACNGAPTARPTSTGSSATDTTALAPSGAPTGASSAACPADQRRVYEAGCGDPPRTRCVGPISLPVISSFCTCDKRTVESPSNHPPEGVRYRFEGPCARPLKLRAQPEPGPSGQPTGKQIVWLSVGSAEQEVGRFAGPCAGEAPVKPPDLIRMTCGVGRDKTELAARREGGAVVIYRTVTEHGKAGAPEVAARHEVPADAQLDVQ